MKNLIAVFMVGLVVVFCGFAFNVSYEKTYKSPNGVEIAERFNIHTTLDFKLEKDKQGNKKTAH